MHEEDIKQPSELTVGNTRFHVVSHFGSNESETVDKKLIKLMEKEMKNRMTKPNFL